MNFIRQQSGGIIVQEDLVTIFKKSDVICTTPFVKDTISCLEGVGLLYDKEEDYEMQKEYNQLEPSKRKLEPVIEDLKIDRTIGEYPIKNINRTKDECVLQIINLKIRLTYPVIKATPYEQEEFNIHINDLKQLVIIEEMQSPHRTRAFIVNRHS